MRIGISQIQTMEPPDENRMARSDYREAQKCLARYRMLLADLYQHMGRCEFAQGWMAIESEEYRNRIANELDQQAETLFDREARDERR